MHTAAVAAAAAIAQATKASGVIVRMEPQEFLKIVHKAENALVVMTSSKGFRKTKYQYLTSYKGLAFYTKSQTPQQFGIGVDLVSAKQIWIPG